MAEVVLGFFCVSTLELTKFVSSEALELADPTHLDLFVNLGDWAVVACSQNLGADGLIIRCYY